MGASILDGLSSPYNGRVAPDAMLESPAVRIVVDAMGGDHGAAANVAGAVLSARDGTGIILVGRRDAIEREMDKQGARGLPIEIVHAETMIPMDEKAPAQAVRTRRDNSMSVGIQLVRHGEADGFVTAGNTGAAMTAAAFGLGRVKGVQRPALAAVFPAVDGPVALLDVGANAEARPEHLVQFAIMGVAYAERVLGIENPRVGLISIGEERSKGSALVQAALPLLEAAPLRFIGNIEGQDVPMGRAEVVVTDGFTGNVMLKLSEGIASLVTTTLRREAKSDLRSTVGGLLLRPALGRIWQRWDYRGYGGAMLLGVRGTVVIGHGRSDAVAVQGAIAAARRGVEHKLVDAIAEGIAELSPPEAGAAVVLDGA
ncbi:MAG: phosphate acyltransferase PlsX [Ardenticatenales bacterium]